MKAYKLVRVIDGKFYSYLSHPSSLKKELERGWVVQYELNKKTTYKRDTDLVVNKFLYCFPSLDAYKNYINHLTMPPFYKLFECEVVKSKSKQTSILSSYLPASSVTLIKEVTL